MSLETGEKPSEVSLRERATKTILFIEKLERTGVHAHSLIRSNNENPGASVLEELDRAVHTKTDKPTFAERNRIITRRKSRRIVSGLLKHC